ncbi:MULTISPECIES: anthranilate synthase component II [unclassified Agarivorans]|uniref:anthranilate synthase component II n=1 Tax=unclassified Agarivorans TaxID=2636026 RepID=UPI0026E22B75|nr:MULTISPECIES: aminodeoxychorismate/anthranilate synthase component II [unclassified Agarivorans]MDO6686810.1 aminodeoxychorismate/anthranilate synthase component II [Agarivorans sp. 3_MG-2023]MDO6716460.1 aminodeoxychorismate/anthranilate synthase component II [Agarivorans sp. 2_MG-2023]
MLLIIDNYDSFTYNLYQYFSQLNVEVVVRRNDEISIEQIKQLAPSHLLISPGPCSPNEAGISLAVIAEFANTLPILGVCLGHQCIAQHFGGKVVRAAQAMHGKVRPVYHQQDSVFSGLANPMAVTRYHSLVVQANSLPECLEVTAWSHDDKGEKHEIMGLKHKHLPIHAVQFHPESILTKQGLQLLSNFIGSN